MISLSVSVVAASELSALQVADGKSREIMRNPPARRRLAARVVAVWQPVCRCRLAARDDGTVTSSRRRQSWTSDGIRYK